MNKIESSKIYNKALKSGDLVRPETCEECGKIPTRNLDGHHDDYDKPLDVQWLCASCHKTKHRKTLEYWKRWFIYQEEVTVRENLSLFETDEYRYRAYKARLIAEIRADAQDVHVGGNLLLSLIDLEA